MQHAAPAAVLCPGRDLAGSSVSQVLAVMTTERRARWFLIASVQSAIGSGAATVGLVVIAYDRLHSPWALTVILLADFLPVMVLGPLVGAIVDRWSRRGCVIVSDALRAGAFAGIALVSSFDATVALAILGGIGTALFSPAALSALPSLVAPERRAAVTSLYGATRDLGRTLGPLLAAALFPLVGAETLMAVNGATFLISGVIIALIPFGDRKAPVFERGYRALLRDAREGVDATRRITGVRVVLWASTAIIVFAAMVNVGELLLARKLGASSAGFAVLMAGVGVGVVLGSLLGAAGGALYVLKRRYLVALCLVGLGTVGLAASPAYGFALVAFMLMGFGNGAVVVHERLIFQAAVPERLMGRAFALLDTLGGWGFALAFIGAGGIIAALGTRGMFYLAGAGGLAVWALSTLALRNTWLRSDEEPALQPPRQGSLSVSER
jgi:MFS family permease